MTLALMSTLMDATADAPWLTFGLAALNILQTIALAYIAVLAKQKGA